MKMATLIKRNERSRIVCMGFRQRNLLVKHFGVNTDEETSFFTDFADKGLLEVFFGFNATSSN